MKSSFPFTLTSYLGSVLSSLTYPFLSSGCEHCNWHYVLRFNFLSRPDLDLLKSTLPRLHTSTTISTAHLTHATLKTFNSLLCPPPTTSLRADYFFFTFFTNKTSSISSQFSAPHMQELKQPHLLLKLPSLPSVPSLRQKYPNVSSPATLQHALLIQSLTPSPSYLSLPALTHIIIKSLLTGTFPNAFKQARVTPLLTKPTLNTSLTDSYRPVSLKSNQIKSNHFYCHITTAQVPWWVKFLWACSRQCKKNNNKQFTYGQAVQKNKNKIKNTTALEHLQCSRRCKKTTNNLHMDRQCKKTTNNLHMDRQCKKTALEHLQCSRQCKKKTTIYIWTVHIYRLYRRQCAKYTYIYSVHIVYYKDTLNYQRHIIHRMGTSTLCTLSIHNVVYT